ncbi:MAG: glycosyltransferase family protein [Rhodospirillaceae bacterium]|jgi:spore coat polysaccharide biosynthesis protein SpsF|nr:glycosyltransferase family protein [Rhodospirillaceae bacterium]
MMQSGKTVAIVQARMNSTRLPGKVMKPLAGAPLIIRMLERVKRIKGIDEIAAAVPDSDDSAPLIEALSGLDWLTIIKGPEADVLTRTAIAARETRADTIVRITSDCPLVDPAVSESVLAAFRALGGVYARTSIERGFPLGFDTEVLAADILFEAEKEATDPYEREHVTPYIWRRPEKYPSLILGGIPDRRNWRLVVDTPEDYEMVKTVYDRLYASQPEFGFPELCALFSEYPEILKISADVPSPVYVGLASDDTSCP